MEELTYLQHKNPHTYDNHIQFDEGPHVYHINGDTNNVSVTTLVHNFFPKFEADQIIKKMMRSPKWPSSPYFGMTASQIKQKWKDSGSEASQAGTCMHLDIERYYNQIDVHNTSVEFQYFQRFEKFRLRQGLVPYRTEWVVFDLEHRLAGSIDMVYQVEEGNNTDLVIYDWKRSKEIKKDNTFEYGYPPLEHLPHCNFWHYSLQLNIYKYILEHNYETIERLLGLA